MTLVDGTRQDFRSGMAPLFPLSVGKNVSFMAYDNAAMGRYWTESHKVIS